MYASKKLFLLIIVLAFAAMHCFCQDAVMIDSPVAKKRSVIVYAGSGVSYYTAKINTQPIGLQTNINRFSPAFTLRVMWHPQYRLRLGIETGYTDFYSYNLKNGNINGKVSLTAIPVLIVWSMPVLKRVSVFAGFGSYFLTSRLNYSGKVNSKSHSLGSNIAIAYAQPISRNLRLVAEAKWMDAFVTRDHALSLQVHFAWRFLEW